LHGVFTEALIFLIVNWDDEATEALVGAKAKIVTVVQSRRSDKPEGTLVTLKPEIREIYRDQGAAILPMGVDLAYYVPKEGRKKTRQSWGVTDEKLLWYEGSDECLKRILDQGHKVVVETPRSIEHPNLRVEPAVYTADLIASVDAVVIQKYSERFPLEAVVAMMYRIPVISVPYPLWDYIGGESVIYWQTTEAQLEETLQKAVKLGKAHPLVEEAFQKAWEHLTATAMAERWERFLKKLI